MSPTREPPGTTPGLSDPLTRTLLALTFVTGIVDAVTFLGLGQVFAAMQTGNVIFLGLGVAGTASTSVVAPLVALGAFVAGGGAAAWLATVRPPERAFGLGLAMVVEVVLLGAAAVVAAAVEVDAAELSAYVLIGMLSLAMGLRNTTARRIGGQNLATTVLNLTLIAVAAHSPLSVASGGDLAQRAVAILAILLGALTGALLWKTSLALPLAAAAAIALAATVAHHARGPARHRP